MAVEEADMVTVAVVLLYVPTEQVTPASALATVHVKLGVAEKLLIGVKVTVDDPPAPGTMVSELGAALSEKSGVTVVKLDTLDQVPYTPLEEDKACTSQ